MSACTPDRRGFSIIELMIVVLVISILGMLAQAAFHHITVRARGSAFVNDGRVFVEAFGRYAHEKGDFPPDAEAGVFPAGMAGYLNAATWGRTPPLGGVYDWDNKDAPGNGETVFRAAVKVSGCRWTLDDLQRLDEWFDNGDLASGTIRVTDAGATVIYVIEP
ncbi:MAG TPA: prepilin-type N-terminal cleavage/methylation domain-containing protein [Opitutaceae bacterium]|nr:prepilin-type N-terminal cleavage/methylation domain-containing protein [Opitutaceae bacterium]